MVAVLFLLPTLEPAEEGEDMVFSLWICSFHAELCSEIYKEKRIFGLISIMEEDVEIVLVVGDDCCALGKRVSEEETKAPAGYNIFAGILD